jgi:hypothetical protein
MAEADDLPTTAQFPEAVAWTSSARQTAVIAGPANFSFEKTKIATSAAEGWGKCFDY